MSALRARTYLAPSLPLELFELICAGISETLDRKVELTVESAHSGPMHTDPDPFAADEVDLGFLCSPSYLHLSSKRPPSVALVPAGLVFADPRAEGRPVYYSDVVVRGSHEARRFADLQGRVWGYNDRCSLSGYYSTRQKLGELGGGWSYFAAEVHTGSHLRSVEAILTGDIDAAAIDSNVLARLFADDPWLREGLRVIESWGPFPIQPIVLRSGLALELAEPIASALLSITNDDGWRGRLAAVGLRGFAPVGPQDYDGERCEMRALGLMV